MNMKKVSLIILSLIIILSPVALIATSIFAIPSQYSEAYVGALNEKVDRLKSIEEDKIVVIGGSSVAFALDSALMEKELGMPVVNFGLYAALGTKLMLDLSRGGIKEGDIVILSPELDAQTLSLFFSSESTLNASDDDKSILLDVPSEHWLGLIGGSWRFAADKLYHYLNETETTDGIYAAENFNEYGDIKAGLRPENTMGGYYYDISTPIDLSPKIVDDEFVDYLNEYIAYCESVGATVYFNWCPMNEAGFVEGTTKKQIDTFSNYLQGKINCDFIGFKESNGRVNSIHSAIIDKAYFYDTNFHLNDAGVTLYTVNLINNLYLTRGDFESYCDVEIPDPPKLPAVMISYPKYDENQKYFTYELGLSGMVITGLTEEGKAQKTLTIPVGIDGYIVSAIGNGSVGVFEGGACTKVIIPEDSKAQSIRQSSFGKCNVTELWILQKELPNGDKLIAPYSFADTKNGFKIYVNDRDLYMNEGEGYQWGTNCPNRDKLLVQIK